MTTVVAPGSVVLLHTDGLYERRNRSILVGEAVLLDVVPAALADQSSLQQVADWLPELIHETEPEDDICIVALRRPA